ncbi:Snf7-domain-containing protein [Calycina marina]|uniref:Vacuolar-sorting protein SNF7 n=1 Tax=Calycina marina TaxID=1763456 RepID=A0A9P7YZ26_9HELO|nr:Snf7-domain-containing protein [Calycina marina]
MSGVWGWFGGQAAQKKKDSPKNAILGLRQQLEMLQKRERHLQNQMDEQDTIARKNVSTNKTAARQALKRKKQHEHTLEQTTAQISTLEQQIYSIEAANINRETLAAMENAGKAMSNIHGKLTVDKVDDTMEKLREQHALADEISTALQNPIGEAVDEGELEDELEALEQEQLDDKMLKTGTVPMADEIHRLPQVGTGEIKSSKTPVQEEEDEEEELRKLQAEMAM